MGAPYALSSDLVSAWPAKSLEVAQYIDGQVPLLAMTQNAQTGTTYTFVAADFTKLVTLSNASPVTVTVPLESSVPWVAGTQLRLMNLGAGLVTVVGAVGVTINGSPLTLTQYKNATLTKTGTNIWTFTGISAAPTSGTASVATSQSVTNAAYTDLATVGPSVTLTTGTKALVIVAADFSVATNGVGAYMSFAVSGATTQAAADIYASIFRVTGTTFGFTASRVVYLNALTAGSNVFTAKYSSGSGSFAATFANRYLAVIDLGS